MQENRAEKLWIASDARAIQDKKFVDLYYPDPGRFSVMIITAKDNVLTPSFLRAVSLADWQLLFSCKLTGRSDLNPTQNHLKLSPVKREHLESSRRSVLSQIIE